MVNLRFNWQRALAAVQANSSVSVHVNSFLRIRNEGDIKYLLGMAKIYFDIERKLVDCGVHKEKMVFSY